MIVGVGIDIIEVGRIQRAMEKNPRFCDRIFTEGEVRYCEGKKNRFQHLAARFAAKEAFFKALGRHVGWTAVEVVNLPTGQPRLVVRAQGDLGFAQSYISLSHLSDHALAVVILER
jgi:holo-[acyl-carrier protein] synthase